MKLYESLPLYPDQTRLIRLESNAQEARLGAGLIVASIDASGITHLASTGEQIQFSALSYTWGTGPYSDSILLNGFSKDIKENLADFLYQFRSKIAPGTCAYLWVDAICINQEDDEEKAEQVSKMRSFYDAAERVVVWLGRGARYTAKAAKFLHEVEAESRTGSKRLTQDDIDALYDDGTIHGLVDIYSRPWSTRIWIKQEVWTAQWVTVWCGSHQWRPFPWVSFAAGLFMAVEDDLLSNSIFALGLEKRHVNTLVGLEWGVAMNEPQTADSIGQRHRRSEPARNDILDLLRGSASSESSDTRDRIYALIGMSTMAPGDFGISYRVTTEEAFTSLARHIAVKRGIGALLGLDVPFGASKGLKLPSWVPDWRYLTDGPSNQEILVDATMPWSEKNVSSLKFEDNKLILKGRSIVPRPLTDPDSRSMVPSTRNRIVNLHSDRRTEWAACHGSGLLIALDREDRTTHTFRQLVSWSNLKRYGDLYAGLQQELQNFLEEAMPLSAEGESTEQDIYQIV